jgi:hypothetical protein
MAGRRVHPRAETVDLLENALVFVMTIDPPPTLRPLVLAAYLNVAKTPAHLRDFEQLLADAREAIEIVTELEVPDDLLGAAFWQALEQVTLREHIIQVPANARPGADIVGR